MSRLWAHGEPLKLSPETFQEFLSRLQYDLPEESIATQPSAKRDESKLLVFDRSTKNLGHRRFSEIGEFLRPGDVLVLNQAKVDQARILWEKPSGGKCELLLLRPLNDSDNESEWDALVQGKNLQTDKLYDLGKEKRFRILEKKDRGLVRIGINANVVSTREWMNEDGLPPLPPYIRAARKKKGREESNSEDRSRYQTEYAERSGAVAAPTAGLHFSLPLLEKLQKNAGVQVEKVHLAVGWGTFSPLSEEAWREGKLHSEYVNMNGDVASRLLEAMGDGRRIIAVGTTVVRTLEWWSKMGFFGEGIEGDCDLFIRPGWKFKAVNGLVTNFHLPGSSLLALLAAFLGDGGRDRVRSIYDEAIDKGYRFYSYGDATLIL